MGRKRGLGQRSACRCSFSRALTTFILLAITSAVLIAAEFTLLRENREMTRLIRPDCWLGRKPSVRKKNLRFGIVYSYHAKVSPLYKQAVSNREKYCDAVGVACIDQSDFVIESLRKEGKSSFNLAAVLKLKITSIINAIENNSGLDWILFTDIDILILNFELKLSEMVSRVPDETIMIISPDAKTINTGCFFVRADEDGLDLLKSWHSTFINKQFISDQQAFNSLYNTLARRNGKDCNMDESDKSNHGSVKSCYDFHDQIPEIFVPRLCALAPWGYGEFKQGIPVVDGIYVPGDFAVHFAGRPNKVELMQQFSLSHEPK